MTSGTLRAGIALAFVLFGAVGIMRPGVAPALAADGIECGDVLDKDKTYTLTANVGPCDNEGDALTVVGPARLDLNGHTVSCLSFDVDYAVRLVGRGAKVFDGSVRGCNDGVGLYDDGRYQVTKVTATENNFDGFDLGSPNNRLNKNRAIDNDDDGFDLYDEAADRNVLTLNRASANGVEQGGGNGFRLQGDATENALRRNRATNNDGSGILAGGSALDNTFKQNKASGNGDSDLADDNLACDNNTWKQNTGTTSQGCID